MNKIKNLIWILSVFVLCVLAFAFYKQTTKHDVSENSAPVFAEDFQQQQNSFSDGLNNPDSITTYHLDEYDTGIAEKAVYYIDINHDKTPDRITRTFFENGNAHSFYEYKIELNINNRYVDITPQNFRTTNGDTCDLQQIQFIFKPVFQIVLIYRELGDTWVQPTVAKKQVFKISNNELKSADTKTLRAVCDVKELF